jgi:hypothetical protein
MISAEKQILPYLECLRALNFVQGVEFSPNAGASAALSDGILRVRTPQGTFVFDVERKNSYLDRSLINAWISDAKRRPDNGRPMLLLARYVPMPSGERLAEAGVNFVDRAGNMHLALGSHYSRTIIGRREVKAGKEAKQPTGAKAQLLFTFAAFDHAPSWTVRQLAEASGVSKSNVAKLRKQLVEEGVLTNSFHLRNRKGLAGELLRAYEVLRPRLLTNRFRGPHQSTDTMLRSLQATFAATSTKWSLTGGPAADELQHFYKGLEITVFVDSLSDEAIRKLRLLPDKRGPLIFLRSFGTVPYWKEIGGTSIAHPWLIYSELMHSSDPRAHEAAEQLKAEFLKP